MDWKGILGIALGSAIAGLILGLAVGMRGCDGGVNKLLEENAELKVEVTRQRFLAEEAEGERERHAVKRNAAEREVAAMAEREAASLDTIQALRRRVIAAGRKTDERDDLIIELDRDRAKKVQKIDLLQAALDASKNETEAALHGSMALNAALVASETRADKLERRVLKDRQKKIWIGVGSAIGGAGVMALAVYGAGRL